MSNAKSFPLATWFLCCSSTSKTVPIYRPTPWVCRLRRSARVNAASFISARIGDPPQTIMMNNNSNDESTIRLTKSAVAMAFPEFEEEDNTEDFPSFDRLYMEVDDSSLSMLSSSVGHDKNDKNNTSDLEVPSTPTTCTSWFSRHPRNKKQILKSYRRLATPNPKRASSNTNDKKKRCGCWDSMIFILCLIILCGCGLFYSKQQ